MRSARLRLPDFLNLAIVDSSRLKSRLVLSTAEFEMCMLSTSHVAGLNQWLSRLISSSLSPVSMCAEFTLTFGSLPTEER